MKTSKKDLNCEWNDHTDFCSTCGFCHDWDEDEKTLIELRNKNKILEQWRNQRMLNDFLNLFKKTDLEEK